MADHPGFTLSTDNYARVARTVKAYEHDLRRGPRPQAFSSSVLPLPTKVYQVVYGTRLRVGTEWEELKNRKQPVCIAIELGTIGDDDIIGLTHENVYDINQRITALGFIEGARINGRAVKKHKNDPRVLEIVKEQTKNRNGFTLLKTKYAQGYCATGSVVYGHPGSTEEGGDVLWGGRETFELKLQEKFDDGTAQKLCHLIVNQQAVDLSTIRGALLQWDRVALRDPLQRAAIYIPSDKIVVATFNQQIWFDDDNADDSVLDASARHWYERDNAGNTEWLPCFNLISPVGGTLVGKTDAAHAKSASGTISIWTGTTQADLTDSGDNLTAWNRFAAIGSGKWVDVTAHAHGWEAVAAEC